VGMVVLLRRIGGIIVVLVSNKGSYSMYSTVILTLARQSLSRLLSVRSVWKKVPVPDLVGTGEGKVGRGESW